MNSTDTGTESLDEHGCAAPATNHDEGDDGRTEKDRDRAEQREPRSRSEADGGEHGQDRTGAQTAEAVTPTARMDALSFLSLMRQRRTSTDDRSCVLGCSHLHATPCVSTVIVLDPARRSYDAPTRERLVELFGAPERWGATTHSFNWARVDCLVPSFTGATSFELEVPCTYDLEVAASKYFYSLRDGLVPLSFHFTGMVLYRDQGEQLRVTGVPWSCSARWSMPVEAWKATMASTYPGGGWIRLSTHTLDALQSQKAREGHHSFDATVAELLGDA